MNAKEIALLLIAIFSAIPLITFAFDIATYEVGLINATTLSEKAAETIVDFVLPWWLPLLGAGIIGVLVLVGVFLWLGKDAVF